MEMSRLEVPVIDDKLKQLYEYCQHDLPIFPLNWINTDTGACSCGKQACSSPGKHPLMRGGFKKASADPVTVGTWHKKWPNANWGMRTGSKENGGSGLLVVDIDINKDNKDGFGAWEAIAAHNIHTFETVAVVTGNLGLHYWFLYPEGDDIPCSQGALGVGLDIRAEGGYVLVPPSATTNAYLFDPGLDDTAIAPVPEWLLVALSGSGAAFEEDPVRTPNVEWFRSSLRRGPCPYAKWADPGRQTPPQIAGPGCFFAQHRL
jgi:hypothetical protein